MVALAPMVAPLPNHGFHIFLPSFDGTSGIDHIGENHGGPQENIVFANHPGVDGNIVLDLYIVAKDHLGRYHHILSQVTIFPNYTYRS